MMLIYPAFWFLRNHRLEEALSSQRLERAIGVVYRPETERASHYFNSLPFSSIRRCGAFR